MTERGEHPPGKRPSSPSRKYPVADFFTNVGLAGLSWSFDGSRLLVSSDRRGIWNAWAVPTAGGEMRPLTDSLDDPVFAVDWFPHDDRLLCTSQRGGNEMWHVYVRETDGSLVDLTPGDGHQAGFLGWASESDSFFIRINDRDRSAFDVHRVAVDGYRRTKMFTNVDGLDVGSVSRDGRFVALVEARTSSDKDIWMHDREAGTTTKITSAQGIANNIPGAFSPDARQFLFLSDGGRDFLALFAHDLASGATSRIREESWDVTSVAYSTSGKHIIITVNDDARSTQRLLDAETLGDIPLHTAPGSVMNGLSVSPDDERVACYLTDGSAPPELHAGRIGEEPARLTDALDPRMRREDLVRPEVIRFPASDGLEIPAILHRPRGASDGAKLPAVVLIHGGPGGQALVGYDPVAQALANNGYVVLDVNHRGSSGYGKRFAAMANRRHGEADLRDVIDSREMLAGLGFVDGDRIGIMGSSYGGFIVLAALTMHPDAFAAGVDLFGVANWFRTLESLPAHLASARRTLYVEMGDPAEDAERLRRISPVFHGERIRVPLMVLQGANDPRVLQVESDEIVAAARRNGVPVEYIVFPGEGHGFHKRENKVRGYTAVIEFLDVQLKGAASANERG